jgi:hypothetical protein
VLSHFFVEGSFAPVTKRRMPEVMREASRLDDGATGSPNPEGVRHSLLPMDLVYQSGPNLSAFNRVR